MKLSWFWALVLVTASSARSDAGSVAEAHRQGPAPPMEQVLAEMPQDISMEEFCARISAAKKARGAASSASATQETQPASAPAPASLIVDQGARKDRQKIVKSTPRKRKSSAREEREAMKDLERSHRDAVAAVRDDPSLTKAQKKRMLSVVRQNYFEQCQQLKNKLHAGHS